MNKIIICGCPASGKTTLSRKLSEKLSIPVLHLDKIFWIQEGGIKQDVFIKHQEEMMLNEKWIIDGDFTKSRSFDIRLNNSDTIIYFDFSKILIFYRLLKRRIQFHNKQRPEMGGDNIEKLNWKLIKFIWNYSSKEKLEKILSYSDTKKVFIIKNLRDEKEFIKKYTN